MPKVKLRLVKDPQFNEYQVLVYFYTGGAFRLHDAATYFTDDRQDAIDTRADMMQRYEADGYTVRLA